RRAEALDPNDQAVQIILGRIQQYRRRFNEAEHHFQRALALAPNDAEALIHLSTYFAMQGQPELGITLAERSLDLNPLCPYRLYPYAAIPYFVARRYREALELGQKAPVTVMVDLPGYYAAAAGYLEDRALASTMIVEFDRQFRERIMNGREPEPEEQLLWVRHVNPFRRPEDLEHLVDGIERARKFVSPLPAKLGPTETASGPAPTPRLLHWPIANTFRVEGSLWTIAYEGHVVHLPELKGYRDIAYLLARPDDEVHCLALAGRDDRTSGAADEVLDRRARRAYQSRIQELRAELAEAADANDPGRTRRAQEELDALVQEVARATGIGGRSRKLGDPAERARTAVTWRIRKAVKTLSQLHAALGKHLSNSLQTGVFCRYSPEKPVDWEV
ncbi:MAG TPA: tetratricopeptide repeat protein, partial [Candidatus Synoicihabitans sp.]|nr:tetratricopeptide repeat protein [Candidatus Synoicihabitans sp.]